MEVLLLLVLGVVGLLVGLYTKNFRYWKKRNIPYMNPSLLAGNWKSLVSKKKFQWEILNEVYTKNKDHPIVGFFQFQRPVLVVKEPELIKCVLTKEFSSFHDRGFPYDEEGDPVSVNLFNLDGKKWKYLRAKLSPAFTSGKLKLMFNLIKDVGKELNENLKESVAKGKEVELKNLFMRYSADVIGTCAFGVKTNALADPKSHWYTLSLEATNSTSLINLFFFLINLSPTFSRIIRFSRLFPMQSSFFLKLMQETVKYRTENKVERNDFVNLMMKIRDGEIASPAEDDGTTEMVPLSDGVMAAQAAFFFNAGMENPSNITGFCLHALALDPDLQSRAATEVRAKVKEHGDLTYEALREMDLLQRIVSEGLRMYTPVAMLVRTVTKPLQLPGTDYTVDEVPIVQIPVWQIHYDPDIYPEPERFDPDRFTEEAKRARHAYTYLPFGEGPRFCIAERFARLHIALGLAFLLRDFQVSPGLRTEAKPQMNVDSFVPAPKNGFWLQVEERPAECD